jgi:dipeptidyl-peptidase-3
MVGGAWRAVAGVVAVAAGAIVTGCRSREPVEVQGVVSDHGASSAPDAAKPGPAPAAHAPEAPARPYLLEKVDDAGVVQLYADGFERLSPREKILCWHLCQAAIAGRDVFVQQKCAEGLAIREILEEMVTHSGGVDPATLAEVRRYLKLFWINNSPYSAITSRKFVLRCAPEAFDRAMAAAETSGADFAAARARLAGADLKPILFDPRHRPMCTAKNPEGGQDIIQASAVNFYEGGVTMKDLEGFAEAYPLNASVVKAEAGGRTALVEKPWRAGDVFSGASPGMYADQIVRIVGHLEAAIPHAPDPTKRALEALVRWYRTGREADRRAYDVAWVADKDSSVDTINGFVEVYLDPRGKKGAWEGIVFYEDPKKAASIKAIAANARWFEDHMPYDAAFRKPDVKGISARSIDVVVECGDAGPVTPIGINLPNDQEVREKHGSKSVSIANVVEAYERSTPPGAKAEFCWDASELDRTMRLGPLVSDLITNMHEVIGHASGRQAEGRQGDPAQWIREYYSALEEARADLVALYFLRDPKLGELGLVDDVDEASRQGYEQYTRNGGLVQLRRVKEGDQLEEDHMRNRQLVVRWIQAHDGGIEERERGGKHYLVVTDPDRWRAAAGRLLALVQRLKSTGDYEGTKALFDRFGIKFDPRLRDEVVARYEKLDVPSYVGFVMPRLTPVLRDGEIVDVAISYPLSLEQQMLEWSGRRAPPAPSRP